MDSKKLKKMQSHNEMTDIKGKNKQIHCGTFLGKVLSIFPLSKRPKSTTEHDWEIYTGNRLAAERKFPGAQEKKARCHSGEEDSNDQDDVGEDDAWRFGDDDKIFVLRLIRRNMNKLEDEMCLEKRVLQQGFRLMACDAVFENENNVSTETNTHTVLHHKDGHIATHCYCLDTYLFPLAPNLRRCSLPISMPPAR